MGGLGNQMFQIATVYAYAKRHGFEYGLNFDACHTPNQGNESSKYKDNFFKDINRLDDTKFYVTHKEPSFCYNKIAKNDDIVLDGYFQSEKYFKDYKDDLIKLFNPYNPSFVRLKHAAVTFLYNFGVDKKVNYNDFVAVHVRRGDYLKNSDFHTNLSNTDYYKEAMNKFENKYFIFISDDINWCRENFKGENIIYSPFTDELQDLLLMSYCGNQIIANSSFSWWGAYLRKNELIDSKVIAPKQWFGPRGPKDTQDIIPDNWIKI